MVRIKVIKKSQLIASALIALAVAAAIACGWALWQGAADGAPGALGAGTALADGARPEAAEDGADGVSSAAVRSMAAAPGAAGHVIEVDLSATPSPGATDAPAADADEPSAPTLAQILDAGLSAPGDEPSLSLEGKSIFIYHTHTHESYAKQPDDDYVEISAYRTGDSDYSVVRVGEELARQLRALGAAVTHDSTDYEQDSLSTSYNRSLETLERLRGEGRTFDLWLDLHRDAYSESGSGNPFSAEVDGAHVARLMVLLGTGEGTSGGEAFDEKPDFERNLVWGQRLTDALEQVAPGITRPLMIKTGRYNQHISERCLLIEVGHNRNTLDQALGAMPYLTRAIALALA